MAAVDIISLNEAKDFLNEDTTVNDAEISNFITAASTAWVSRVGPVAGSPTYDEWYDGGGPTIALRHIPVQSVTSITEAYTDSIAYTLTADPLDGTGGGGAYGYTLDQTTGLLVRRAVGTPVPFAAGIRNVHVVYTAGYATTPEDVKQAVKLLLRHMWETQRGTIRSPRNTSIDTTGAGFTWPNRVLEIANAYMLPGIA